jgi:anthranilate phosphoribosyltransferase
MQPADLMENVLDGGRLGKGEAADLMTAILKGHLHELQTAAVLGALRVQRLTPGVLAGFSEALLQEAEPLQGLPTGAMDCCGTGGDGASLVNVSTAVAFVLAAGGVAVIKHGNRGVSSSSGSSDVLQMLGVNAGTDAETVRRQFATSGLGFVYAPAFHPVLKRLGSLRKALRTRTVFNLLGPLVNPAMPSIRLIGVYANEVVKVVAESLPMMGVRRALVVHGAGLDELSPVGPNSALMIMGNEVRAVDIIPEKLGVGLASLDSLRVSGAMESANRIEALLEGVGDESTRKIVALNAGAGFWLAEKTRSLQEGVDLAMSVLDSGKASDVLRALRISGAVTPTEQLS